MHRFINTFFLLFCAVGLTSAFNSQAQVDTVTAQVDKNPAMVDESITLSVTANGNVDSNAFDSSALLKDFVVGRTSVSSSTQIINFNTTRSTTWNTVLIPRKPGPVTIPAFEVAGQYSQPIDMIIMPASSRQSGRGQDLFITTEVDSKRVYLHQQIKYTVKLHLALDLQRGSLAAPTLENAVVRQIGKDAEYTDIIDSRRYRIIERVFAIIPQQSGQFSISGPLFEGEVVDNNRQSFGFFNRTKPVNRIGPAIDIQVMPVPNDYPDHWLPSEFVQLHEEWQPGSGDYKVGEPITRTLTLTAVGLVEEQLPEIAGRYPPQVKTYPDQANTATVDKDNTLIAQRIETIAIIPNQPGTLVIPEVSIPWFNVVTEQTEYASLPARSIQVAAADPSQQAQLPLQTSTPALLDQPEVAVPQTSSLPATPQYWSWLSGLFCALWLLTATGWLLHSKQGRNKPQPAREHSGEKDSWRKLQDALRSHNVGSIYPALSAWLAWMAGEPTLALPSSQRILADSRLDRAISNMFASQYNKQPQAWKSDTLATELNRLRQQKYASPPPGIPLKPLYPLE